MKIGISAKAVEKHLANLKAYGTIERIGCHLRQRPRLPEICQENSNLDSFPPDLQRRETRMAESVNNTQINTH